MFWEPRPLEDTSYSVERILGYLKDLSVQRPPTENTMRSHRAMFNHHHMVKYYKTFQHTIVIFSNAKRAHIPYVTSADLRQYLQSLHLKHYESVANKMGV